MFYIPKLYHIALEGPEGSGKSIVSKLVEQMLDEQFNDKKVLLSIFPSQSNDAGKYARQAVSLKINSNESIIQASMNLDRILFFKQMVEYPQKLDVLITDRSSISGYVYACMHGLDIDSWTEQDRLVPRANRYIVLLNDPEILYQRNLQKVKGKLEIHDTRELISEAFEVYSQVHKFFPNVIYINRNGHTVEQTAKEIVEIVKKDLLCM